MKLNAPTLCKRRLMITLAAMAGIALAAPAQAQGSYPNKPIRMIVPLAAGSAVDARHSHGHKATGVCDCERNQASPAGKISIH